MSQEHIHARQLLKVIRDRIANDEGPIHGYAVAGVLIGLNEHDYARHMGQVTSRIDAASFIAGWPMLAVHMVRKPDGEVNPASFSKEWSAWNAECKQITTTHKWTVEQVDEVIGKLDALPDRCAKNIWDGYLERDVHKSGFIAYNMHRKLKNKVLAK